MQSQSLTTARHPRFRAGWNIGTLAIGLMLLAGIARADERAQDLLRQESEVLRQTQTLSAEFITQTVYPTRYRDTQETGTVLLARPGLVRIEIDRYRKPEDSDQWIATGNGSTVVADGSKVWTLVRHPQSAQYRSTPEDTTKASKSVDNIEPLRGFFRADSFPANDAAFVETRQWENATYDVVSVRKSGRVGEAETAGSAELYFGRDGLIHRYVLKEERKDGTVTRNVIVRNIKRNGPVSPAAFRFTPPSEAETFEQTVPGSPIAPGTEAPDFTVEDSAGNAVHLSDLRGKVVILKFWATWCWSCRQSLPQTDQIARRFADKDVVVLAVDIWDSRKALRSWLAKRPAKEPVRYVIDPNPQGKDAATTLYHIRSTPTQFVISKEGRILKVVEGYEGPNDQLETALTLAGITDR